MIDTLFSTLVLAAAAGSTWIYWQMQQRAERMQVQEDELRQKTVLVGELADELSMASRYLYDAMDDCLARIEKVESQMASAQQRPVASSSAPAEAVAPEEAPAPSAPVLGADTTAESGSALVARTAAIEETATEETAAEDAGHHAHLRALELAAQKMDPVEIARHTGVGVEELRLLLRFQQELFSASDAAR